MDEEFYYEEAEKNGFDDGFNEIFGEIENEEFSRILKFCEADEIESEEDSATRAAQKAFGVKFLFPWQRLVISNILDAAKNLSVDEKFADNLDDDEFCRGRQIVLLPTGAGKSMCFLVPSLLLPGATVVFYPLLALMADQKRRMDEGGISCVMFKGGQTFEEREENFRKISEGARVILANPEVLQNEALLNRLAVCNISHIAIDESHCVAEWGDSFRPMYLTLGNIIKRLGCKIVTAFTATASPPILKRVGEVLFDNHYHLLKSDSDRANLHYSVKYAYAKEKAALECTFTMRRPMIIFCSSRSRTENMARLLSEIYGSDKAKFYHAGMTKEEKNAVEKWFFDSDDGILAATCAYGMGMDKGNIYSVVHLDAPEHLENFCQEAGRAGRKGDFVHSVLLWNYDDYMKYKKTPVGSRERVMGDFVLEKNCRRQFMLDYLGGEKTVCSGCDLCDARKNGTVVNDRAADAEMAFKYIKKNRRYLNKTKVVSNLTEIFNNQFREKFKINVWEEDDIETILSQLASEKRIRVLKGLWKNKVDLARNSNCKKTTAAHRFPSILPFTPLHRLVRHLVAVHQSAVRQKESSS